MLSNVDLTQNGHLIIHDLNEKNLGVYECQVKPKKKHTNQVIKKQININFSHQKIDEDYDENNIHNNKIFTKLPPLVRIVPIHMDVREGGRVELECESGMNFNLNKPFKCIA